MVTLEQVQEFLNIKSSDKDEWLEVLINVSAKLIQDFTGIDLTVSAEGAKLFNGTGADFIRLASPVSNITEILINGIAADLANYYINDNYLESIDGATFPVGRRNIKITADWGVASWPEDLLVAQRLLLAWLYQKNKDEIGVDMRSTQGQATKLLQEIPPAVIHILQNYKLSVI